MIEPHPLTPFLPHDARLLMLGSFPPQQKRWSMTFYYPNWNNDMWRIVGLLFFNDRHYFECPGQKRFDKERLVAFLNQTGIGLYDTASAVRRLRDNASDKYLEVITPTHIPTLLAQMPHCHAIVTTGEKATQTLCAPTATTPPPVGGSVTLTIDPKDYPLNHVSIDTESPVSETSTSSAYETSGEASLIVSNSSSAECIEARSVSTAPLQLLPRQVTLYRMPSSSRAYPLSLEKKAAAYRPMFEALFPEALHPQQS